MSNNDTEIQVDFQSDLKEGNENNFGSNKILKILDHALIDLVKDLSLESEVTSSVFNKLFKKEVTLNNDKPDNFTQVLVKYKSAQVTGGSIDVTRSPSKLCNLNHHLDKLHDMLSNVAASKIGEFIRRLVCQTSNECLYEIEIDKDEFYLTLTVYSPKDMQSIVVEVF